MPAPVRRALAAAAACAGVLAAVLLAAYAIGPVERFDARALIGFAEAYTPDRGEVAELVAHLADPLPLAAMLLALCGLGALAGRPRHAVAALFVVGGANVTTQLLKLALAHPRVNPTVDPVAFPSGHATAAMSISLAAVLVAPPSLRPAVGALAAAYALAVSLAILLLDWHYPSDVLGGMLVAACFGFLALAGLRLAEHRWPRPDSPARAGSRRLRVARALLEALVAAAAAAVLVIGLARLEGAFAYARFSTAAAAAALIIAAAWTAVVASLIALSRE
jgi:membrane-associated phospholipid phosphatase